MQSQPKEVAVYRIEIHRGRNLVCDIVPSFANLEDARDVGRHSITWNPKPDKFEIYRREDIVETWTRRDEGWAGKNAKGDAVFDGHPLTIAEPIASKPRVNRSVGRST